MYKQKFLTTSPHYSFLVEYIRIYITHQNTVVDTYSIYVAFFPRKFNVLSIPC